MSSVRSRAVVSSLRSFFENNKKVVICTSVIFVLGIVAGILSAVRSVDGEFERIARADMDFGSAKVFFISSLALVGGYIVILISGHSNKTVFLAVIPFFVLGFMGGEYCCILIARYESTGIINLLLVYLPFFLSSFVCLMLAATNVLQASCTDCTKSSLKPSFIAVLKILGINVCISFVFIMIIGSIFGVVIVKLY